MAASMVCAAPRSEVTSQSVRPGKSPSFEPSIARCPEKRRVSAPALINFCNPEKRRTCKAPTLPATMFDIGMDSEEYNTDDNA
jgi:hypothetical protein